VIKAVVFDMDGTLVDSNQLHAQAWQRAFAKFGIAADVEAIRRQIGKGGDKLMPVFVPKEKLREIEKPLSEYRDELFMREYMPKVKPFPGARGLLERIRKDGHKIGIATSASEEQIERLKNIAHVEDLIERETNADDVEESKPAPDIFSAALSELNVDADEAIAVGDTPYDAEAAAKIHLRTIGLTCGGWSAEELKRAGCIEVFAGPADLLAHYGGSALDEGNAAA
jgi:HAD superfamily hydrolase (TIGR01509 family)